MQGGRFWTSRGFAALKTVVKGHIDTLSREVSVTKVSGGKGLTSIVPEALTESMITAILAGEMSTDHLSVSQ